MRNIAKCFEATEKDRKEKEVSKTKSTVTSKKKPIHGQSTLANFVTTKQYDTQSIKHKTITLQLAKFFGATNVPVSLVDNAEFREFVQELDPHFNLPRRKKMGFEIDRVYDNLKSVIISSLQGANHILVFVQISGQNLDLQHRS